MVYGDGDGELFRRFTVSLDVIGHELTHGVTDHEAALEYHDQPGALNESFSDVFGSLVKQRARGQTAAEADWLIGEGLFTAARARGGAAIAEGSGHGLRRSGPRQRPAAGAHGRLRFLLAEDNGGVHINSGIPNHAFYLAARRLGGFAWEKAGRDLVRRADRAPAPGLRLRRGGPGDGERRGRALRGRTARSRKAVSPRRWKRVGL